MLDYYYYYRMPLILNDEIIDIFQFPRMIDLKVEKQNKKLICQFNLILLLLLAR